jgi:hypothetical protein
MNDFKNHLTQTDRLDQDKISLLLLPRRTVNLYPENYRGRVFPIEKVELSCIILPEEEAVRQ